MSAVANCYSPSKPRSVCLRRPKPCLATKANSSPEPRDALRAGVSKQNIVFFLHIFQSKKLLKHTINYKKHIKPVKNTNTVKFEKLKFMSP